MGSLAASGTSDESIGLTAPASVGTYYYGACVDAVTGESDTSNNCSSAVTVTVGGRPDLVVESPSVDDDSPETGGSFTLSATVSNDGDGGSAAATLRYYRSADATISGTDTEVGTDAVGSLAASGTSDESIGLTAPASVGTYYYGACVDAVTGESDTSNNCSSAVTVTVVAPPPDLVVGPRRDIRRLLYLGATSVISSAIRRGEVTDPWLRRMLDEKPRKVVAVALANRMARIIWAVTVKGESYRARGMTRVVEAAA